MRIHKYRAWDKVEKHFVYFELGVTDGKMWTTPPIYTNHVLEPWQEYTGIKDKNVNPSLMKEIYEGDILKCEIPDYSGVVVFEKGQFGVKDKVGTRLLHIPSLQDEVIGNVWENPELLKK